jgi:hypothetical protein
VRPYNGIASPITVGWLLDSARAGKLPRVGHPTAVTRAVAKLRISLVLAASPPTPCRPYRTGGARRLDSGATLRFRATGIRLADLSGGTAIGAVDYATPPRFERQLVNVGPPLTVRFELLTNKHFVPMLCQ